MTIGPTDDIAPTRTKPSIVDAKADNNEETDYPHLDEATFARSPSFHALHDWPHRLKRHSARGLQRWSQRARASTSDIVPEGGKFIEAVYTMSFAFAESMAAADKDARDDALDRKSAHGKNSDAPRIGGLTR